MASCRKYQPIILWTDWTVYTILFRVSRVGLCFYFITLNAILRINAFFITTIINVVANILSSLVWSWPMVSMTQHGWRLLSGCDDSLLDATWGLLSPVLHGYSCHQGETLVMYNQDIYLITEPPHYPRVLAWSVVWTQDVSKFSKKLLNSTNTEGLFRHTGEEMTSSCSEVAKYILVIRSVVCDGDLV